MYLQDKSQFDFLVNQPESTDIAGAVNNAMRLIETDYKDLEGKIIEDNSFYSNPHGLTGKCDFVMANPPFNVKKIDKNKDYVKEDPRLPFGVPKAGNGNYMWIQYFNSYLNEKGRAGFVMASSATDAGNSEKLIPCHLWFFDKGKLQENKNKILMLDARNTYRVVNTTINDFSDGQLLNLTTIVQLYRGNVEAISIAETEHKKALIKQFESIHEHYKTLAGDLKKLAEELKNDDLVISESVEFGDFENPGQAKTIFEIFEKPAPKVLGFIKGLEEQNKIEIYQSNDK